MVTPVDNQQPAPPAQTPTETQFQPDSDHEMNSQPEQGDQPTRPSQMDVEPTAQINRNERTQQWVAENAGGTGKVRTVSRTKEYTRGTKARQIQKPRHCNRITKPIVVVHQNTTGTRHRTGATHQQTEPPHTGIAGPVQPTVPAPLQPQAVPPPHHPAAGPVQPSVPAPVQPQPGPSPHQPAQSQPVQPPHHLPQKLKSIAPRQYEDKRQRDWQAVREKSRVSTREQQDTARQADQREARARS